MRQKRSRYVALCQQFFVAGTVVALGATAAGIHTLEIVPAAPALHAENLHNAVKYEKATVDVAPVSPKVEEVVVTGMDGKTNSDDTLVAAPGATSTAPEPSSDTARMGPTASPAPQEAPEDPALTADVPEGLKLAVVTQPQDVHGYGTVGVTWQHGVELDEDAIKIQVRTEAKDQPGQWTKWQEVDYHDDHGPDTGSAEDVNAATEERPGTDAIVVGDVALVQMRALTQDGTAPADMKLAVIDPGTGKTDTSKPAIDTRKLPSAAKAQPSKTGTSQASLSASTTSEDGSDQATLAMSVAPMPQIYSRAQWGANESMRSGAPSYGTIKTGFVHHTVNANTYTEAEVPALLRGIYAYHTKSRGWSDIGYNFLVDRFGRIWEGRYGGVDKAVVGAHTLGYNEVAFGMSAIGNFDIVQPPQAVLDAFSRVMAWKLSMYGVSANATGLNVKGKILQGINGHRDVGSTACPGRYLYAQLGAIRNQAAAIQNGAQVAPPMPAVPFTSPTQAPAPALPQPPISFPRAVSLDGGSYPDVVTKAANGDIRVVPTNGQIGFGGAYTSVRAPAARGGLSAYVGDTNFDGAQDVLTINRGTGAIYRGTGAGTLSARAYARTRAFRGANMLTGAGDWTGDGKPDAIARIGRVLKVFPGGGANRWNRPVVLRRGFTYFTSIAVPGDVNGDGTRDLVALGRDSNLYVIPARGGKLLGAQFVKAVPGVTSIAAGGDLTGDARPDVVLRSGDAISVLAGVGGGRFGLTYGPFNGFGSLRQLSVGQMGSGAQADILGISGTSYQVRMHNERTNVSAPLPGNLNRPGAIRVLAVGDWNRDGRGDLITVENGGDQLVFNPGNGNGTFGWPVVMSNGWKPVSSLTVVGDVTGEGNPDLMGRTAAGTVIFPGDGKSGFTGARLAPSNLRTFNSVAPGAWDAASWSVATGSSAGIVPRVAMASVNSSIYDIIIGSGDVDGDGYADIIARDRRNGDLMLIAGWGGGTGAARLIAPGFGQYQTLG